MFEEIDGAAETLKDPAAGWVNRRDAAELLGKAAIRALDALDQFNEEMDVDVRRSVDDALGKAAAVLQGVKPILEPAQYTLEQLVRFCEKPDRRTVEKDGEDFDVRVVLKSGRTQTVHVRQFQRADGVALIQVYTICGKADEKTYGWALRANMKLIQGAIALARQGDEERFVLSTCFLSTDVTPRELKAAVKETAYYGDWIEQKVSGLDEF